MCPRRFLWLGYLVHCSTFQAFRYPSARRLYSPRQKTVLLPVYASLCRPAICSFYQRAFTTVLLSDCYCTARFRLPTVLTARWMGL
jgi:hypothetical protein